MIGCVLLVGAGCSGAGGGGATQTPQELTLHEVADIIRSATGPTGKGPTKVSDFDKFASVYSRAYEAAKSGEVVVIWGGTVKGEGDMAQGGDVIAYEKDAPANGGYVLLTSGEVKKMSAADFNAAPKGGKK
ncbi:hypothetical protein [Limnoglobus roseus]|uniref:hypothetical protein n=1 Tax=Limnoglobus roseus TaxID=2598579 RepID=UPI00143E094B|nr:hypothetical protein [Limnoglobus roseus]